MTKKEHLNALVLTDAELNSMATLLIIFNGNAEAYNDVVLQGTLNDVGESASDEAYKSALKTALLSSLGIQ